MGATVAGATGAPVASTGAPVASACASVLAGVLADTGASVGEGGARVGPAVAAGADAPPPPNIGHEAGKNADTFSWEIPAMGAAEAKILPAQLPIVCSWLQFCPAAFTLESAIGTIVAHIHRAPSVSLMPTDRPTIEFGPPSGRLLSKNVLATRVCGKNPNLPVRSPSMQSTRFEYVHGGFPPGLKRSPIA